jgi:hypothetical protein
MNSKRKEVFRGEVFISGRPMPAMPLKPDGERIGRYRRRITMKILLDMTDFHGKYWS